MDETSGTRADSHGAFGLLTAGAVSYVSDGIQGNAADCASGHVYKSGITAGSLFGASGPFTMAGWVRIDTSCPSNGTFIYTLYGGEFLLLRISSTGDVGFLVWDSSFVECGLHGHSIKDNAWHFLAFGIDASNKGWLKLDGDPRDTAAATLSTQANRASNTGIYQFGGATPFGDLDEWSVWQRALTDGELDWLYNSGLGRTYAEL